MFTKNSFSLFLFSFLLLIFSSCKKSDSGSTPTTTDEIRVGSRWVFKYTQYNENGSVVGTTNLTFVATTQTIAGSSWLLLTEQSSSLPYIALQKRTDGWWQVPLPNTTPSLWFKYPCAVNDSYNITVSDGTTDTGKVTSTNASVTVPAGTYNNCIKVEQHDTNSLEDEYWFTTAGPIVLKVTEYDEKSTGGMFMSQLLELVSFTK
jgi:hypothetical protein